jgi:uncharacterized membrane protein YphA (DoxX/SURF4 family)
VLQRVGAYGRTPVLAFLRGPYPTLVSRLALGLVFLVAGVGKAADPTRFASDIRAYQMLPGLVVTVIAYGLPWLEIGLAVYLLAGLYVRWAAAITGALLIVFMIAMGQALARGLTLNCGCFGGGVGGLSLSEEVSVGSILRDAVWLVLAVHLVVVPSIWTLDERLRERARRGALAGALPSSAKETPGTAPPRATASARGARDSDAGTGAARATRPAPTARNGRTTGSGSGRRRR